ncbi:MAG: hypothetical protein HZA54_08985 [Planctomycetes bacterium]|nr:hypothetical protein [Planctomycetota bacterium]
MSTLSKVFVILILVVSLVYLGVTATLFAHRTQWKHEFNKEVAAHAQTKKDLDAKVLAQGSEIASQDEKIKNLDGEKRDKETQLSDRSKELEKKSTDFDTLKGNYATLAADISKLKDTLTEMEKANQSLQDKLKELQAAKDAAITDRDTTQAKLLETENRLQVSEKNLADLEVQYITRMRDLEEVKLQIAKLQEIGVPVEVITTGSQRHVEGKVLAVSEKMNLLIISAGKDKGVEQGYEFTVYRGGKYIGKVRIQKADKDWSSASALSSFMKEGERVEVGDSVSTRP